MGKKPKPEELKRIIMMHNNMNAEVGKLPMDVQEHIETLCRAFREVYVPYKDDAYIEVAMSLVFNGIMIERNTQ